jgi:hypothetical protein
MEPSSAQTPEGAAGTTVQTEMERVATAPYEELVANVQPLDDLDSAFRLNPRITQAAWQDLYQVLVNRMRLEAGHLQMNTVQLLLIERIAANYIELRVRESAGEDDPMSFTSTAELRSFNNFWLAMTKEFNTNLRAASENSPAALLDKVSQVFQAALSEISDRDLQKQVRDRMINDFRQIGL